MKARVFVFVAFVVLLVWIGVVLSGCAVRARNIDRFEWWTRYYETRMGLVPTEIRYGETPGGFCAQITWEVWITEHGVRPTLVTVYNPDKKACRAPWSLALHEACHRRMQHHVMGLKVVNHYRVDIEGEAKECERWYRSDVYSGSVTRASRRASRTALTRR
jgi:hypothetical protein